MTRALRLLLLTILTLVALPSTTDAQGTHQALRLAATRWLLVSIDGSRVPSAVDAELAFTVGGHVHGRGGCNDLEGSWTHLGGEGISISDMTVGRERCSGDAGRTERRLLDQLILVTSFVIADDELTFTTTDGTRLVFRSDGRSGSELVGDWLLTAVDGDPAADIPRSTATFGEDGSVTGSGGCNTFRGTYGVTDDALRVRHLLAGRATCADHVMSQETGFLDVLGEAASWSVADDTLTLAGPRGRHSITLHAVRPVTHELTDTDWSITSISEGASAAASATIRFSPDGTLSGW